MSIGTIGENVLHRRELENEERYRQKRASLRTLHLTIKAFRQLKPTSKHKRETLYYAFEQLKPLLKRYMKENHVLAIRLDLQTKHLLALEPINNAERQFWIDEWLNNEVSTRQLKKRMKQSHKLTEYLGFSDFLSGVESWLSEN